MDTSVMAKLMSSEDIIPSEKPLSVEALFSDCMPSSFPQLLPSYFTYDAAVPSNLFNDDPHDELGLVGSGLPWDLVGELEGAAQATFDEDEDEDEEDEEEDADSPDSAGSSVDTAGLLTDFTMTTLGEVTTTTPPVTALPAPASTTVPTGPSDVTELPCVPPMTPLSGTKSALDEIMDAELEGALLTEADLENFDPSANIFDASFLQQFDDGAMTSSDNDVDVVGLDSDPEDVPPSLMVSARTAAKGLPRCRQLKQMPSRVEMENSESEVMRLLKAKTPAAKVTQSAPCTPPATPSKEIIQKIKNSSKRKSIIMLPTALPSRGERGGKAVELAAPLLPRKLQRLKEQDISQSAPASPTGLSHKNGCLDKAGSASSESDSDASDSESTEVNHNYFEVTIDHDYCQNVPAPERVQSPAKNPTPSRTCSKLDIMYKNLSPEAKKSTPVLPTKVKEPVKSRSVLTTPQPKRSQSNPTSPHRDARAAIIEAAREKKRVRERKIKPPGWTGRDVTDENIQAVCKRAKTLSRGSSPVGFNQCETGSLKPMSAAVWSANEDTVKQPQSAAVWSAKEPLSAPVWSPNDLGGDLEAPMSAAVWSPNEPVAEETNSPAVDSGDSAASSPAMSPEKASADGSSNSSLDGTSNCSLDGSSNQASPCKPETAQPKKAKISIADYVKSRMGRDLRYKSKSPETVDSPASGESSRSSGVDSCTPQESILKTLAQNRHLAAELKRFEEKQKAEAAIAEQRAKIEANAALARRRAEAVRARRIAHGYLDEEPGKVNTANAPAIIPKVSQAKSASLSASMPRQSSITHQTNPELPSILTKPKLEVPVPGCMKQQISNPVMSSSENTQLPKKHIPVVAEDPCNESSKDAGPSPPHEQMEYERSDACSKGPVGPTTIPLETPDDTPQQPGTDDLPAQDRSMDTGEHIHDTSSDMEVDNTPGQASQPDREPVGQASQPDSEPAVESVGQPTVQPMDTPVSCDLDTVDMEETSDTEETRFSKFEPERSQITSTRMQVMPPIPNKAVKVGSGYDVKADNRKHGHRNYRRRATSPVSPVKEHFDKLPSYYTAVAMPLKSPGKTSVADKLDIGGIPEKDRDPSPDRSDPVYDKLPAYFSCFTNSTKYDGNEVANPADSPGSGSTSPGLVIASQVNSRSASRANSCSRSISRNVSPVRSRPASCVASPAKPRSQVVSPARSPRAAASRTSHRRKYSSHSRSRSPSHSPRHSRTKRRHRSRRSSSGSRSRSRSRSRLRSTSRDRYGRRRRSRSWSSSRSRSRSPRGRRNHRSQNYDRRRQRSLSRERRLEQSEWAEARKQRQIEERRIVYVGRIPHNFTPQDLKRQFGRFGEVEEAKVHLREHGGDHYGFVTFMYTCDAYAAIEKGNTIHGMENYDLCFGGRRQFCKTQYADLDGDMEEEEETAPYSNRSSGAVDFDELLRQAMNRKKT